MDYAGGKVELVIYINGQKINRIFLRLIFCPFMGEMV